MSIKILKIKDTREKVEINDRFIPIPGTGDTNVCEFCKKEHEVHVHVIYENKEYNIGLGCAKKHLNGFDKEHKKFEYEKILSELKEPKGMEVHTRVEYRAGTGRVSITTIKCPNGKEFVIHDTKLNAIKYVLKKYNTGFNEEWKAYIRKYKTYTNKLYYLNNFNN